MEPQCWWSRKRSLVHGDATAGVTTPVSRPVVMGIGDATGVFVASAHDHPVEDGMQGVKTQAEDLAGDERASDSLHRR